MKTSLFSPRNVLRAAACAACLALPLRAETDGSIRKTFSVAPGGKLVVDVAGSRVDVQGTGGSQVIVEYIRIVSAGSKEEETKLLKDREVTLTQTGDTVSLVEKKPQVTSVGSWWSLLTGAARTSRTQFRVSVKVPAQYNVDLRTSGGAIEVAGIAGQADVRTSGGSITLRDITGNIDGRTSGGGIKLDRYKGDASLSTSGGGINVADGSGRLVLKTSGGGITISGQSGNVTASTSGGAIKLALLSAPDGENRLTTSGGGITVTVPSGAPLNLDASTSGGGVSTDLPVTSAPTSERNRLVGTVNGGGALVHLRTSGGGIRISADAPSKTAGANH